MTDRQTTDEPINWVVIGLLLAAAFVVILNETIMSVALPHLMADLRVDARTAQWLSTGFMLTMAVVIPVTGFLMDRLTTRTVFTLAMSLFCTGTLAAGLAPGFVFLLSARVIQASGTAVMMPLLMTTILTLVPMHRRGRVMGMVSVVISVAPALGPTISGLVLQFLSWRWMFFIVLPIAVTMLVLGRLRLVNVSETKQTPLDVISIVFSALGFGGLVFALNQVGQSDGAPAVMIASFGICLIALGLFVARQIALQRRNSPLLDLRTFTHRNFSFSLGVLMVAFLSLMGVILIWPIYLQEVRHVSSIGTGLLLLPGGLAMGLLGPWIGRLFDRVGPRPLVVPASCTMILAILAMSTATRSTPLPLLLVMHVGMTLSLAFIFTPVFTAGLNALPPHLYSHGSALVGTLQQVAGAAGAALLVAVMEGHANTLARAGVPNPLESGIHLAFWVGAAIAGAALILALFLRHEQEDDPQPQLEPETSGAR